MTFKEYLSVTSDLLQPMTSELMFYAGLALIAIPAIRLFSSMLNYDNCNSYNSDCSSIYFSVDIADHIKYASLTKIGQLVLSFIFALVFTIEIVVPVIITLFVMVPSLIILVPSIIIIIKGIEVLNKLIYK